MQRERAGDSICTFARNLPARDHDTWVVRAVYEGLSKDRGHGIRPDDRLEEDLLFLPEDIEDLTVDVATRARRSMDRAGQNPLTNRVVTVLDLINFLEHQPKIGRTQSGRRGVLTPAPHTTGHTNLPSAMRKWLRRQEYVLTDGAL